LKQSQQENGINNLNGDNLSSNLSYVWNTEYLDTKHIKSGFDSDDSDVSGVNENDFHRVYFI
jgi:hypothetical protein